jgi:hypothetical protein
VQSGAQGALAATAFVALAVAALPSTAPVKVLTRFSTCDAATSAGRGLIANAEVEPSLAADPSGRTIVVAFQEDRSSRGGAGGIDVAVSSDGGATWRKPTRLFGSCSSGARPVSDSWVSIGPDGRVYASALDTGSGVVVTQSADGGVSWGPVQRVVARSPAVLLDKPTITADPARPKVAYAVWEQYPVTPGRTPNVADTAVATTQDGGRSWSRPRELLQHAGTAGPMTTNVVGDTRTGMLYAFSLWVHGPQPRVGKPSTFFLQRSSDAGRTWSRPAAVGTIRSAWVTAHDPESGKKIRPSVPSFAVDPSSHRLYAAWADDRLSRSKDVDHVVLSSSTDRGAHWSVPRRVDQPAAALAMIPSVAVVADGTVAVTYFAVAAAGSRTTYWLARSRDRGRHFVRRPVGPAFSLVDAPFLTGVPALLVPGGIFLGDYMGLAAIPTGFATAFVTANPTRENPTDVRFARVS